MIAAIYARKSTDQRDRDEKEKSVETQVKQARAYAIKKGWTVDDRYVYVDDAISGAEFVKRPGFRQLLAALDPKPPFQVLVVSELSRIGRDTVHTLPALVGIE